ncbi:hypothetical protein PTKIN_Ptkin17bG0135300 [Pterospermum kingtungense]
MYVTRPLSMYKQKPSALSLPPPEGPNSGILVIQDEEAEPLCTCCFRLLKAYKPNDLLPFPQNKKIKLPCPTGSRDSVNEVVFIPVLDQPLSSNRYYALEAGGSHKGYACIYYHQFQFSSQFLSEAFTSLPEEYFHSFCCGTCFTYIKPQPADYRDMYQQFEICPAQGGGFLAKSVVPGGVPPEFLRRKGWRCHTLIPHNFTLDEAPGLDTALRARLPKFNFPLSHTSSQPVVVGKWYCPFIFIKDGTPKDQMAKSMYYHMTLEQRWEQVFACDNGHNKDNVAVLDVTIEKEVVRVDGLKVSQDDREIDDGVMWFRIGEVGVGLSMAIVERMKWEQERFGWSGGSERVQRVEEFARNEVWNKFGCYVLVERFVLRRMDGNLVLTYDFKHIHHIRSKWDTIFLI